MRMWHYVNGWYWYDACCMHLCFASMHKWHGAHYLVQTAMPKSDGLTSAAHCYAPFANALHEHPVSLSPHRNCYPKIHYIERRMRDALGG